MLWIPAPKIQLLSKTNDQMQDVAVWKRRYLLKMSCYRDLKEINPKVL